MVSSYRFVPFRTEWDDYASGAPGSITSQSTITLSNGEEDERGARPPDSWR
jgi:hypothetical protein